MVKKHPLCLHLGVFCCYLEGLDMDLQDIQNKINNMFSGTERKIVFWYDADGSYADDIEYGIILR